MGTVTGQQEVTTWTTEVSLAGQGLVAVLQPRPSSPILLAQHLDTVEHLCQSGASHQATLGHPWAAHRLAGGRGWFISPGPVC